MANIYHGSCLCHKVQYELTGEPFTFFVCHCVNCRKATGSAFMSNGFFKPDVSGPHKFCFEITMR